MKDPVEARADDEEDLYDIASWEPRTALDRLAVRTHRGVLKMGRVLVIGLGVIVLLLILGGGAGALILENPFVLGLVVLSAVPAALLALYIYVTDITTSEPLTLVAVTFLLGILFAGFAAIVNSAFGFLQAFGLIGFVLFFYLVVGPGEEAVKLLAVRLFAYRDDRFDSVIDGAVYGAVAGLGFATIENVLYITQNIETPATLLPIAASGFAGQFLEVVDAGGQITAVRSLAGPGHVIYSAFAGYYLGLAKFNRENAGPIIVKGLLIAAFIHATYNTLVGIVPALVGLIVPGVPVLVLFLGFVIVYDGLFFYILYRKLQRYRHTYKSVHSRGDAPASELDPELTEFDAEQRE
jgi:RsiW-degrading membrane proteinase PrsW (M82 family)